MGEFTVIRIEEDMDFGCEERPEGMPVMAVVTLRDSNGEEQVIRYPDRELYCQNIREGDRISLDSKSGVLEKWTEEQK